MSPIFPAGKAILRREVLHGQVWLQSPVTVIADDGIELAVLLEPGAEFTFPEHPFGPHPWSGFEHWTRTQVLQVFRPDLLYSVWLFFEHGELQNWYLNFEAPVVRQVGAVDTLDYGLDLVLELDGARVWKDVDDLAPMLSTGRMSVPEVVAVLEAADEVSRRLADDDRWWSTWDDWRPPPPGQDRARTADGVRPRRRCG